MTNSEISPDQKTGQQKNDSFCVRRRLPLIGFFDVGAGSVHELAYVFQDRARKPLRPFNVSVNAWIFPETIR
jgi:hypothetical protein